MLKCSLYGIAKRCAELNRQGCSMGCECCQYNIFNYGLDVNEAALMKATAYTDVCKRGEQAEIERAGSTFWLVVFCIGFVAFLIKCAI